MSFLVCKQTLLSLPWFLVPSIPAHAPWNLWEARWSLRRAQGQAFVWPKVQHLNPFLLPFTSHDLRDTNILYQFRLLTPVVHSPTFRLVFLYVPIWSSNGTTCLKIPEGILGLNLHKWGIHPFHFFFSSVCQVWNLLFLLRIWRLIARDWIFLSFGLFFCFVKLFSPLHFVEYELIPFLKSFIFGFILWTPDIYIYNSLWFHL